MKTESDSKQGDYLDTKLSFLNDLFKKETERRRNIESKANVLLGFTGVMLSLTLGLGRLLIDLKSELGMLFTILSFVYGFVVVISFLVILFAWLTVKVTYWQEVSLDTLKHEKPEDIKRDWIVSLEKAYLFNSTKINAKARKFLMAEKLFVVATFSFVIIAIILLLHLFPIIIDC